ncbi:MAG: ATP-binding protein [Gammaproteobacteria bacterium]
MTAERQVFPARTDALPQVSVFVEGRCASLGVGRRGTLQLMLLAEELFINTVVHGYGNDGRRRVELAIRDCGAEVELVAEDNAPEFNPFDGDPPAPPDQGQVGGYGRLLLLGLSSRQSYDRRGKRNRVTVGVQKSRLAG